MFWPSLKFPPINLWSVWGRTPKPEVSFENPPSVNHSVNTEERKRQAAAWEKIRASIMNR